MPKGCPINPKTSVTSFWNQKRFGWGLKKTKRPHLLPSMWPDQDLKAAYVIPKNHIATVMIISWHLRGFLFDYKGDGSKYGTGWPPATKNEWQLNITQHPTRIFDTSRHIRKRCGRGSNFQIQKWLWVGRVSSKSKRCEISTVNSLWHLHLTYKLLWHGRFHERYASSHWKKHHIPVTHLWHKMGDGKTPGAPSTNPKWSGGGAPSFVMAAVFNFRAFAVQNSEGFIVGFEMFTAIAFMFGFCWGPEFHTEEVATQGV